ncbi:MAG: DNA translocase FtsK [Solirubrobacteraceae bacterium]
MPAARAQTKRKPKPPARGTRSLLASRPSLRAWLELEPHQVDVLALALVALGTFLGGVAYGLWGGGTLGDGAARGTRFLIGVLGYAIPAALVLAGALVLARDWRPPVRPLRTGTICLTAALTLMLAAGTLGIGPGVAAPSQLWNAAAMEARGGILGQAEYWAASHLFSRAGADILALFGTLAGVILLSGATIASVIRGVRAQASTATLALRRTGGSPARPSLGERRPVDVERGGASDFEPLPASEHDTGEMIVRATHVEAPAIDEPIDDAADPGDPETAEKDDAVASQAHDLRDPAQRVGDLDDGGSEDRAVVDDATGTAGEASASRPVSPEQLTPQGRYRASVTDDPEFAWQVPSARFLVRSTGEAAKPDTAGQEQVARALLEALGHFGIEAKVVGRVTGPHITRYELRLAPGIKVSKVANLKDDLAYALAATDIRILAPIPGKTAVGVEVPNARRRIVHLGDVFQEPPAEWSPLTVWLGKDIGGRAIGADLAKMPHLLVAGTTGAGKSACVNAMLCSILLRATPHEVRLVLVDPKQVELNHYESIPHLLTPVITSPKMAANALANLVKEMEQRYGIMSLARTRSLPELNRHRAERGDPPLPYILCVIDELADLMMVAPADVEDAIIRLAQKARAVGIHLVLATQSPRVDVITGMIKANVPSRIAFAVSSQTDSRVILDHNGAESLLGQGDMLFSPVGTSKLQRIQGAYIDEPQIAELTDRWRLQGEPELREELLEERDDVDGEGGEAPDEFDPDEDPLLEEAISLVAQMGTASTSMLQRRLRLGYTRAGRLIDMLERRGIISGYEGSKPRQVLISESDVPRILMHLAEVERGGPPAAADRRAPSASSPAADEANDEKSADEVPAR